MSITTKHELLENKLKPFKSKASTIGGYLLDRLHSLGIEHIFGIPGDYVIRLDKMIGEHNLEMINTTRENPAGYSADAYARIRGLGAAVITYGVGINITNAVSQAYVENSPLVVISGAASTTEFEQCRSLHHLINKSVSAYGDTTQLEIFKLITVDQAVLNDPETAADQIDRVLEACLKNKQPVYLELPRNMVEASIKAHEYKPHDEDKYDEKALEEALEECAKVLKTCKHPLLWIGHDIQRRGLTDYVLRFAEKFQIPIVSSLLGKSTIDEWHPLFVGVYMGGMSAPEVIKFVDMCDCALIFGVLINDIDTGMFTARVDLEHQIIANTKTIQIGHHHYHDVPLEIFLKGIDQLPLNLKFDPKIPSKRHDKAPFVPVEHAKTTTKRVFECIQRHLKPEHFIVTDVGDCMFGSAELILEQNSFIASAYFATLGYGVPGAVGAQIANPDRRVVAIVGDGGFQMNAMELSTAVRYNLDLVVIVLNNHGYGTERPLLEGEFNDILNWNYTEITKVLGSGVGIKATTEKEFDEALKKAFSKRGELYIIEVELGKLDFSPALRRLGELLSKRV